MSRVGMRLVEFMKDNLIMIVMIPSLVGLHWSWMRIQMRDEFVSPEERKLEQPIVRAVRTFTEEMMKKSDDGSHDQATK